jgi:GH24 family phage-related lysozyme (muramidase)
MEGNIVGEEFDEFVVDQIKIRQSNQFSGYGTSLRTDDQLKYLTNRNAWVKLASSVDILEGDIIVPLTGSTTPSGRNGAGNSGGGFPGGSSPLPGTPGSPGNTGTGFPQSPSGAIPGLTSIQVKSYKSQKLRDINIENPENYPGSKLAESAILFNSLSSFNPTTNSYSSPRAGISNNKNLWNSNFAYGLGGTDYGIQPPPGITGATVDSLNRGSIRKATVTLKAHNKFQFDIIELLYLRLGFTMMLEWGWDKYLDNKTGTIQQVGNTIIEEKWFTSNSISQIKMLGFIQDKRNEYDGNYDGFFGKVSNFTWSFNPDGSYDISIDLITVGDVIESLKVNTFAKGSYSSVNSTSAVTNVIEETITANASLGISTTSMIAKSAAISTIGYYLFEKVKELNSKAAVYRLPGFNKLVDTDGSLLYYKIPSTRTIRVTTGQGRSEVTQDKILNVNEGGDQYYVRLGEFLSRLESLTVPLIQNGGSTSNTNPQISINYIIEENLVSFFPNQISFDPKICILRPLIAYGDISGIVFPDELADLDGYAYVAVENGTTQVYGSLMSLYVNFEFLSQLIISNGGPNQELSLFKFMQDLCNGINDALGDVNKLEPIVKNDRIVTIIDQTLSKLPPKDITNLEIYGYNPNNQTSNFVKDIKFVSKITPQLASMISIGATAAGSNTSEIDGTAFSKWSEGLIDRFTESILEPDGISKLDTSSIDEKKLKDEFDNDFPPAYNTVERFFMRIVQTGRWLKLKTQGVFKDTKRITNPYYEGIYNQVMTFDKFFVAASEIIKNKRKQNIYQIDDLPELVNNNYAAYLTYAFGGTLSNILIQKTVTTQIRGGARGSAYTSTQAKVPFSWFVSNARYLQYNDTFITQGKGVYKNYLNILNNERYKSQNLPSSDIGFIPLSFELTLDGISGIKIYNKLNINNTFLPSNYPESLKFIITKVNHNISNNSWDTSLSTISIPVTEPYPLNISNTISSSPTLTGSTIDNVESTFRTDPKQLTVSENLINFLKKEEAFRDKAYDDAKPNTKLTATTPITGTLTVGYGFTNAVVPKYIAKPIVWNTTITRDVADQVLTRILKEGPSQTVKNNITVPLTQYEFDALVSIVYNVGNINDSNLVKLKTTLNNKDYQTAASLISQYKTTSGGIFNAGLANRRKKEQQIFISGTY